MDKIAGLREAIKILQGVRRDWPDAAGVPIVGSASLPDPYVCQFVSRIEERILALEASNN